MNRILLILLVAVLAAGCSSEIRVPARQNSDINAYVETTFANIYGLPNVNTMMDAFDGIQTMEAYRETSSSLTVNFRVRGSQYDFQAKWMNFSPAQVQVYDQFPFQVKASCVTNDCYRIAVLVSYQASRDAYPLYAAVTLQVSPNDSRYYKVIHSAPSGTQVYMD